MDMRNSCFLLFTILVLVCREVKAFSNSTTGQKMYGKWDMEKTTLRKNLMKGYDKYNLPVGGEFQNTTDVWVFLFLRFLNDFDEVSGHLESTVIIQTWWYDTRLRWNSSEYNGYSDNLVFNLNDVWVPHLILWNPTDKFDILDPENNNLLVNALPDASIYFLVGHKITTHCVPNVRYFPFDKHECYIDLIVYESLYFPKYIVLRLSEVPMDFQFYENPQWKIQNGKAEIKDFFNVGIPMARFPFMLERRPFFLLFNLIAPILLLSLINVCVFAIPIDSGERTSFAITVFLALAVYMTVVADSIPHSSNPMPLWSYFLFFKLIFSSCIALFSTVIMRVSSKTTPIPKWILCLTYMWDKLPCCGKIRILSVKADDKATESQSRKLKYDDSNSISQTAEGNGSTVYEDEVGTGSHSWRHAAYVLDKCLLFIFLLIALLEILLTFAITVNS